MYYFAWGKGTNNCLVVAWCKADTNCGCCGIFCHKQYSILWAKFCDMVQNQVSNLLAQVVTSCAQTVNQNTNVAVKVCKAVIKRTSNLTVSRWKKINYYYYYYYYYYVILFFFLLALIADVIIYFPAIFVFCFTCLDNKSVVEKVSNFWFLGKLIKNDFGFSSFCTCLNIDCIFYFVVISCCCHAHVPRLSANWSWPFSVSFIDFCDFCEPRLVKFLTFHVIITYFFTHD